MHHELRRPDRAMSAQETQQLLERGFAGGLATTGEDGWPYVIQLSYVLHEGKIYFHHSNEPGHMAENLAFSSRVCFEVNEPGPVFPSGEAAQCETSVGFESLILFGHCTLVTEPHERLAALRALMAKYADPSWVRPDSWPDMKDTAVYCISIEKITGKRRPVTVAPKWQDQFPDGGAPLTEGEQQVDDFTRYVILLTTRPGKRSTEAQIRAHIAHLRRLEAAGQLELAGPFADHAGGMIIIRAGSLEDARTIAAADPFVAEGVEDYEVRVWELSCEANNHLGMGD